MQKVKIYNTLTKRKEDFESIENGVVKMYNCGPTVYSHQHIGNMYSSVVADTIRRTLEYLGYQVKQVMNITDVGHLVSDEDAGEDKMEKGAAKLGKTVWEVAEYFTKQFMLDVIDLNVSKPEARPRATEFIQEMIEMNKILQEKGFAYETEEALYFDVSKFPKYTELSGQNLDDKKEGVREEIYVDSQKRNPADFSLWFKTVGRFKNHTMHWPSPWGEGFPGWHIECSAMIKNYFGKTIDIHTGGVEHIPVHHTNEIAQSESANGTPFVNYWVHHQLILVDGKKMSKSLGNVYTLTDLKDKGYDPMALKLLFLQSKYREQLNFTFESLDAAQASLNNIRRQIREILNWLKDKNVIADKKDNSYQKEFEEAIADDFNTSVALSVLFKVLKDQSLEPRDKVEQLLSFDEVFGLKLEEIKPVEETQELKDLKIQWQRAREEKNWLLADKLRADIYEIENAV